MVSGVISRRLLLAGTAALAVSASACSGTSSPSSTPKNLSVGATLEPPTLDPTMSDAASIPQLLLYNVYETLVKMDFDGNIKPLLAERWDVSGDGLTYTFNLQLGAKFASGTAVDAAAVVAGIERMRNSASATIKSQLAPIVAVSAKDSGTVIVTLSQPSNAWLYSMTSTAGMIVDPATTDMATKPMGSGPFAYSSWTKGDSITLVKNTKYWGTPGRFDQVVFRYYVDPNAMITAMLSGDLDIISNLQAPQSLSQFSDAAKYTIVEGTTTAEVTMGFNHSNAALSKLMVRQAICYAIDRKALLSTVWAGHGQLIGSHAAPTEPYYEDLSNTYPYDPAKAKALLAEAGVSNLSLRLRVPVTKYATDSATFVQSQLKDVGITVTIEQLDFSRWLTEVFTNGDYDMTIVAHVEPRDLVKWANPKYYWHYNNPAFQALVKQADAGSSDDYVRLMKQAAKMLADDAAADWLFLLPNLIVTTSKVTGVGQNATSLSFDLTTIAAR
ncbi:MAG: ABC transporter substrate-binding protein [Actinobacteria bacterium]|nr:ABC transporter substrate-binding protein [Actinomycetota bacterium]